MTLLEHMGQCNEKAASEMHTRMMHLDDNITVGEIKAFCKQRSVDAKEEVDSAKENYLKLLSGKCLRIEFSSDHIVLLKIEKVEFEMSFSWLEPLMTGEKISFYKGQYEYKEMSKDKYESHVPNNGQTEITESEFNAKAELFKSLSL